MSRVVLIIKKIAGPQNGRGDDGGGDGGGNEARDPYSRAERLYQDMVFCLIFLTSIFTELNSHEQLSLFIFENYALSATPNVVCNFLSMNDISGESL